MCKDLKGRLKAGRDEVETSKRQKRRRFGGRRGSPAGARAPGAPAWATKPGRPAYRAWARACGTTRRNLARVQAWMALEERAWKKLPRANFTRRCKSPLCFVHSHGRCHHLGPHAKGHQALQAFSYTEQTVEDHRTSPKAGPREAGQAGRSLGSGSEGKSRAQR